MAAETTKIQIPENELPSLKFLAHIEEEFLQALSSALAHAKPNVASDDLSKVIARESSLDDRKTSKVLQILFRLSITQRRLELRPEDFFDSIVNSIGKLGDRWNEEDTKALREKIPCLVALLALDGIISLSAKAGELMLDQSLVLYRSKVVTDVRPIFNERVDGIFGFVPFHTLVISVFEDGESKDIHLALDTNDVIQLQGQLERAEKKELILRSQLTNAGMVVVQTKADDVL